MQIKDLQKKRALHSVLLVLLLSAVGMTNAMAQSFTVDDLNYSVNEDETSVTLTGHYYGANATGSLYIPNEVTYDNHTYAVTAIGYRAFYDCRGLTGSLVIPDTVTEIGEEAFSYCWGFTGSLTIGANVSIIGRSAFYRCEGFTGALTMTHPLSSVGSEAFYNCYGLTGSPSIVLTGTIGSQAFYNCSSLAGELTIGEAVTSIGDWAFRSCSSMAAVHFNAINCADMNGGYSNLPFEYWTGVLEIGENVERIPNYMFKYANFTGSLVIPDAVTEIGQEAFYFCNDFTGDLTIGANVSSIGQRAFYRCEGFTGTFTMTHPLSSVGSEAFYNCHGLSGSPSIILTGTIGNQAFYGCSSLSGEITIGEAVTSIGSEAFRGCSSMAAVHFNAVNCANVNSSNYPFCYCTGILEIGPSVERIPNYMFKYAAFTAIHSLAEIPPVVGTDAFYGVNKSIPVYVPCGSLEAYQNTLGWSEFTNIQENCSQQAITLAEGWNWFSTYIEVEDPIEMLQAIEESLGENGIMIKSSDVYTEYDAEWEEWLGDLGEEGIVNEQMYKILVSGPCTVTLEGIPANPADHTITINQGWNWIGFPSGVAISLEEAFAGFAQEGDIIRNSDGETPYDPEWGGWFGDFETLEPGQGYMYYSASSTPRTLVFPGGAK